MNPTNMKVLFFGAIIMVLWGGYKISKASYTALAWDKVDGTIVDMERSTWSCGKGVSRCFTPIAGYHVRDNYYTLLADKKFNNTEPKHLVGSKVAVYYSPLNPADAVLGGEYGPMNGGIIIFLLGAVILAVFWFVHRRNN